MSPVRSLLYFVVGLMLSAVLVPAFASNVIWKSTTGMVVRNNSGQVVNVRGIADDPFFTQPNGGAFQRGTAALTVGGKDLPVSLSRDIPKAGIASGAGSVMSRLGTVGMAAGMVSWLAQQPLFLEYNPQTGMWEAGENGGPEPVPGSASSTPNCSTLVSGGALLYGSTFYWRFASPVHGCSGSIPSGYDVVGYCYTPAQSCQMDVMVSKNNYVPSSPYRRPATLADLSDGVDRYLTANPSAGGDVASYVQSNDGDLPQDGPTTATGPATLQGPSSTTQTAGGNTVTNDTTYNITYNNNVVTITTTTNSTTTDQAGNVVEQSTTQTETPAEVEDDSASDTPFEDIPKLWERKYEDGLIGVWNAKADELKGTDLGQLMTSITSGAPNGGTCPSWSVPVNFGFINLGTHTLQPPCIIWPFLRTFFALCALFVARRMVFGG